METPNLHELIRKTYAPGEAGFKAPDLSEIKARRFVKTAPAEEDLFSIVASFLNMRVKLYHAVIAFLVIWFAVLLFGDEEKVQLNNNYRIPPVSNIAAAHNNSTAPACIQTYVLKK